MPALGLGLGLPFGRASTGGFAGPLDAYSTGLAGAWLPFRGFEDYPADASCFVLRDTADDSEVVAGFNADGSLASYSVAGSAAIASWRDQSGRGRDCGTATEANQPLLVTNVVNGQAVCRLDGVNDEIAAMWAPDTAVQRTLYVVVKKRSAADAITFRPVVQLGSNVAAVECSSNSAFKWFANESFGAGDLGGTVTQWTLLAVKFTDADTAQSWANGSASLSFNPWAAYHDSGLIIGGTINAYADADVAAVLLYDAAHDNPTRQAIQTILAEKFNITLA